MASIDPWVDVYFTVVYTLVRLPRPEARSFSTAIRSEPEGGPFEL